MQVEIEALDGLERKLTIGVPATKIQSEVDQRLQQAATQVRMNGFRPGKVPMRVVRERFGAGIRQEVLADLVQKSFQEVIEEKNLRPAGAPAVKREDEDGSPDARFVCTFEVMPDIELPAFSELALEKPVCPVADADIDKMVEQLRERRPEWEEVDRAAGDGDQVKVDFEGSIDGEPFAGGKGEGIEFVIGAGMMLPDFEAGANGASAGDEKTIQVSFPADYQAQELAGKTADFALKVVSVAQKKLPEVGADFFKAWGVDTDDPETFRQEVAETMQLEIDRVVNDRLKTQVVDALLEKVTVPLPAALVDAEIKRQQPHNHGHDHDHDHEHCDDPSHDHSKPEVTEEQRESAEKRVKTGLILMELVQSEGLKADPNRVRAKIEQLAKPYREPEQIMNWYYSDQKRLQEVESAVLEEQVVELVAAGAQITETETTYEELVGEGGLPG